MMFARNVLKHSGFSYSKKLKGDNYETRENVQVHCCSIKSQ
jgi:hypothetical protein